MGPSIKGIAIQLSIDAVRRVMGAGQLTQESLREKLRPEDLDLMEKEILPGLWYPIESCRRLIEAAVEAEGKESGDYLARVGTRIAKTFFSNPIYDQYITSAEKWGGRSGRIMINLPSLVLNFTKWSYEGDPHREKHFTVEVDEAKGFPDVLRYLTEGFIQYLAERVNGVPMLVTSDWTAADHIVFRGRPAASGG